MREAEVTLKNKLNRRVTDSAGLRVAIPDPVGAAAQPVARGEGRGGPDACFYRMTGPFAVGSDTQQTIRRESARHRCRRGERGVYTDELLAGTR